MGFGDATGCPWAGTQAARGQGVRDPAGACKPGTGTAGDRPDGPRASRPWDVVPTEEPLEDPASVYDVVPTDSRTIIICAPADTHLDWFTASEILDWHQLPPGTPHPMFPIRRPWFIAVDRISA